MNDTNHRMSQPEAMKTNTYVAGVEKLNGHDDWALFKACAAGDMPKVKALLAKDRRLVNAQIYYYQFPLHMAVRAGYAKIVKLLLDQGAQPWDLRLAARERGHRQVEEVLQRAMIKRYHYSPDFDELKEAIIARDSRKIGAVLRRQPNLAQASDASGNNALHWSVITRQLELIDRFAALGTPIDAERADGFTPVLLAVNAGCNSYRAARDRSHPSIRTMSVIVGYLLARGLEFNETPLVAAVRSGLGSQEPKLAQRRRRMVEFLLKRGAATNLPDDEPWATPLAWARKLGLADIEEILMKIARG
jgi:ankyrin repeat protein